MAKHNGLIPSDEADKLYSYPTLPADSTKVLLGNGTWGAGYTHPTRTAVTGKPTANQTPTFGGMATISQYAFDSLGHVTTATDRTIKIPDAVATTIAAGLMSKDDKIKLNGIAAGAQVNTVTGIKGNSENAYRTGNVNITAANVGAAASTHTHSDATTVTGGFMSASDKQTLNDLVVELENMPRPIIRVFSVAGSTVTATLGTTVITAEAESSGIWELKLPRYGVWKITATTPTSETYSEEILVDDVKRYFVPVGVTVKRYGYRIKESEPDPYERVEYILDAVGMTPAHMDFENEVFDYGSWRDVWFVADNKPLMLKYDGTVDYYLDPNDYTLREDGETESDVANTSYGGNGMAQFPLCWIYRYQDDKYVYEIVCNVKWDENYKAYAHTRADGTIADYFYWSLFGASGSATKLRSISGQTLAGNMTLEQQMTGAKANGAGWNVASWMQHEAIRTLMVLLGKKTDTQAVFGMGNAREQTAAANLLYQTGVLKDKGQFMGYNTNNQQMKMFHIEGWNRGQSVRVAGIMRKDANIYVKLTPEGQGYRATDAQGYDEPEIIKCESGYISKMNCGEYGMLARETQGSETTYYCDYAWTSTASSTSFLGGLIGGFMSYPRETGGGFTLSLGTHASYKNVGIGCDISYV